MQTFGVWDIYVFAVPSIVGDCQYLAVLSFDALHSAGVKDINFL